MLKQETREIFKALIPISNKFIIESPKTVFTDEFKQMICSLDLEKLGEKIDEPIAIQEIGTFLSAVDLIEDPEITIKDRIINIKNDTSTIRYLTSDLKSMVKTDYEIIESTKKVNSVLKFELKKDIIETLRRAVQVFKTADTIFIQKDSTGLTIKLGQDEQFNSSSNDFSFKVSDFEDTAEKDYVVKIPVQSILRLPVLDYNFEVKYNKEKDAYRLYLSNSILEIILSTIR